ncbi:MAG: GspE/PulE family protein [Planctomycetes bacterium]|nr:GspE/PulE family protein [Planctomycetota bacterium]
MDPTQQRNCKLAQRLVAAGGLTPEEAAAAVQEAEGRGLGLCDLLCERAGAVVERPVWERIAAQRHLTLSTSDELTELLDPALAASFPRRFLEHHRILPVARRGQEVVVATCDPDAEVPEIANLLGGRRVDLRLLTPIDFRRLRMSLDLIERRKERAAARSDAPRDLLAREEGMAELITLFEAILVDAISARASDVHLERYGDRVRLRLRVDGDLRDLRHLKIGPEQLIGLVNVIKVQANLDIAERRVPQGGRTTVRAGNRVFDLRVQTQPSLHGEHVVIRLLPQDTKLLTIEQLGFPEGPGRAYRRLLDSPSGLVLVVGPTGSGKSTTLYAGLQVLARDATRKVLTIEDPIEYALDDVQQSQVRPELGFVFASAMRSFVREDPDVILVGEIRDPETALEALRASQTGHLVLSTLHCNDAVDAVQRLIDLGMHPNSIASEVLAVFAQRLAKRICPDCRAPAGPPTGDLALEVFPGGPPAGLETWRGRGCSRCAGAGSYGRIAAVEFLPASPAFRGAVSRRCSVDELRGVALDAGLLPMREHALDLIAAGTIAFEELRMLLPPERLAPEHGRRLAARAGSVAPS